MARIRGERWVVCGKLLAVYDEAECPKCGGFEELTEEASFHQASMFDEVEAKHWSILVCHKCKIKYVYRLSY